MPLQEFYLHSSYIFCAQLLVACSQRPVFGKAPVDFLIRAPCEGHCSKYLRMILWLVVRMHIRGSCELLYRFGDVDLASATKHNTSTIQRRSRSFLQCSHSCICLRDQGTLCIKSFGQTFSCKSLHAFLPHAGMSCPGSQDPTLVVANPWQKHQIA